jgi:hypothetical protein
VAVHRSIESLRASGFWPDELDFQDDAIGALQALSDEIAFDAMQEQQQELLIAELRRELRRHPSAAEPVDRSPDTTVQTILHPDWFGEPAAADPYGELAGRHPNANQLLFRPRQGRADSKAPRRLRGDEGGGHRWSSVLLPEGEKATAG